MILFSTPANNENYRAYGGIGSRTTPQEVLAVMGEIAVALAKLGYTLRSGGADGADTAFENGVKAVGGKSEIFISHLLPAAKGRRQLESPELLKRALDIAEANHPAWHKCGEHARALHARNVPIILGEKLDKPVKAVVCWAPLDKYGNAKGGTGMGIRIAERHGIKVYNMSIPKIFMFLKNEIG